MLSLIHRTLFLGVFWVFLLLFRPLTRIQAQIRREQPVLLIDPLGRPMRFFLEFLRSPEVRTVDQHLLFNKLTILGANRRPCEELPQPGIYRRSYQRETLRHTGSSHWPRHRSRWRLGHLFLLWTACGNEHEVLEGLQEVRPLLPWMSIIL